MSYADSVIQNPPPDNGRSAFDFFVSQGLAPHQAAGIVGNLQGESTRGLDPNAINPGDGRDGSDSIGIGQWNGQRAQALKDYATSKGAPWNDLTTQLEFLHNELKGPERAAYDRLIAAQTPEQAGQAMLAYERPKDWNKPGAHPERARYAATAYSTYGQPGAPNSPAGIQPAAAPPQPAPQFAQGPAPAAPVKPQFDPVLQPASFQFARPQVDLSGLRAQLAAQQPIFARTAG